MKGLSCQLFLDSGKFSFISGVDKYRDAIWFYCIFDKVRAYNQDFGANLVSLTQQPVSTLLLNKNLIFGKIQKGIYRFVPGVYVEDLDIGSISESGSFPTSKAMSRTDFVVKITYTCQEEGTTLQDVTFV